ncbi:hypothetical protein HY468_02890 [Candidatus Roizmanbacteria bacterium]|nr:hypothetical protein [Candidatus Roizmanbacteria bacterium]
MVFIWDFDIKKLRKTEEGRRIILQRQIDYGVDKYEKIDLAEVKKNWDKLHWTPRRKKLFQLLIWGK